MKRLALPLLVGLCLMASGAWAAEVYWTPAHDLVPQGLFQFPSPGDLDGDGDVDVVDGLTELWNDGGCPGPPVWRVDDDVLPRPGGCSWARGTLGDLDGDGDLDLVVGCYAEHTFLYWNLGPPAAPQWEYDPQLYSMGCYYLVPQLADLDADGDLDLLVLCSGAIWLRENTGTPGAPAWSASYQGIAALGPQGGFSLADLDGDGDLDMVTVHWGKPVKCLENTGTPQQCGFGENPSMLTGVDTSVEGRAVALLDVDCDGDSDLLISSATGVTYLYLNDSISATDPGSWGTIKALYR